MYKLSKDYYELYYHVKTGMEVIAFAEGGIATVKQSGESIVCGWKGYQVFAITPEFIESVGAGSELEWFIFECTDCDLEWVRP